MDNGGELSANEIWEVSSVLNIEVCTTVAYSPFQNELCEWIHAVTDSMLTKLVDQCSRTSLGIWLTWENITHNSLQMWHGYSYQLLFGANPNLPNIMTDNLPSLQGATTSKILAKHLQALHESCRAFIQSEADEHIRQALQNKIRAGKQFFNPNDCVFYKHEGHNK